MIAEAIEHMLAAGMSHEAVVAAVKSMESAERVKACKTQAERSKSYRDRHFRHVTRDDGVLVVKPKIEIKNNNTPQDSRHAVATALKATLDDEHAEAVIEHRKKMRKPLSGRAARLLAANFAKTADPNAAADTMIARAWMGFEPEWLTNGPRGNTKPNNVAKGPWKPFAKSEPQREISEEERQRNLEKLKPLLSARPTP